MSDTAIDAKLQAKNQLTHALRDLAINFLRMMAGGGKPYQIIEQFLAVTEAEEHFRDVHGHLPLANSYHNAFSTIEAIYAHRPWLENNDNGRFHELLCCEEEVHKHSLRWIAGELANQMTQSSRAENEFWEAVRTLRKAKGLAVSYA